MRARGMSPCRSTVPPCYLHEGCVTGHRAQGKHRNHTRHSTGWLLCPGDFSGDSQEQQLTHASTTRGHESGAAGCRPKQNPITTIPCSSRAQYFLLKPWGRSSNELVLVSVSMRQEALCNCRPTTQVAVIDRHWAETAPARGHARATRTTQYLQVSIMPEASFQGSLLSYRNAQMGNTERWSHLYYSVKINTPWVTGYLGVLGS